MRSLRAIREGGDTVASVNSLDDRSFTCTDSNNIFLPNPDGVASVRLVPRPKAAHQGLILSTT